MLKSYRDIKPGNLLVCDVSFYEDRLEKFYFVVYDDSIHDCDVYRKVFLVTAIDDDGLFRTDKGNLFCAPDLFYKVTKTNQ